MKTGREFLNEHIEETNIPAEHWENEIGEMMDWYADYYHKTKLKLLGTGGVSNSYGFQIGKHIFEIEEDTERDAMLILVKDHWDWIDKLEKVELLGKIEK